MVSGEHSPAGTAALEWAVDEAARVGGEVVVVHAFDVHRRRDLALERDLDRARRDARYRTQSWVVEVIAGREARVPVRVSTPSDGTAHALLDAARDASMLVLGDSAEARRSGLLDELSAACPCPVMLVAEDHDAVAV